nr:hypothetical protein [uncultured Enterobacter sp.]
MFAYEQSGENNKRRIVEMTGVIGVPQKGLQAATHFSQENEHGI